MQKKIVILFCISILLPSIFVGCTSNQNEGQNAPELTESEESYKASCNEIGVALLEDSPEIYKGTRITCIGTAIEVLEGTGKTKYRMTGYDENNTVSGMIYVTSDKETNFIEGDEIQIWGEVLGEYTHDLGDGWSRTLTHVWAFFIEEYEEESKQWNEHTIITYGPWWDGKNEIQTSTEPYYINTELARINWSFYGGEDCHFSLGVWKVGSASSSNSTETIYAEESSGTLYIDNGPGYYYYKMSYENLYYYQLRISEYR